MFMNLRVDHCVPAMWRQLQREGLTVARCTVDRLMKSIAIQGIIRGKPH
ncbi:IS3 family transposase [Ruegeria sp. PrR005]|uniref:IS3 family transposase n=1 Tax=Ruegeria sp. PrR005 TaxID=2706882 RepID=A0A6B2NSL0_9RHOB|nr:IS3 family transposase [Ruegeria sp. PrR005]